VCSKRRSGYLLALNNHNLPIREEYIVTGGFREEDGRRAFEKLAEKGPLPQAIFAVNDLVAIGAYHAIKERGLRIPDDVALVGFGDNALSSYLDPPLTTVRQSPYEMGKQSAEIHLDWFLHPAEIPVIQERTIPTQLIIRKFS